MLKDRRDDFREGEIGDKSSGPRARLLTIKLAVTRRDLKLVFEELANLFNVSHCNQKKIVFFPFLYERFDD